MLQESSVYSDPCAGVYYPGKEEMDSRRCCNFKQQVEGPGEGRRTASAVPDDGTIHWCQRGFALSASVLEVAVMSTGPDIDPGRFCVNPGRR
mgnify:CR=1 FL=1